MQIIPSQSVSQIAGLAGTGQEHSHSHRQPVADEIVQTEKPRAEALAQISPFSGVSTAQQARNDLRNGKLETEEAFSETADVILNFGI